MITYILPIIDETTQDKKIPKKYTFRLEDISLIFTNRNNSNGQQALNVLWLNLLLSSNNQTSHILQSAVLKRDQKTLS